MPITYVPVSVPDAATYTVRAENSGLTHYIPNLTADITITLPAPKAGLWFEFAYSGVAADAQDWIINTGSDTNYFDGGLQFIDNDTDVVAPIAGDGNSNSKLTVLTPDVGTRIRVESRNGTLWTLSGFVGSATIPSFADQ
jgi:hypothetical protein